MKILVVDDEALLVKGIRFNLQSEGYDVITGTDGLEAVKLVQEQKPDLVVLDVMMPHMDGMTACSKIREFSDVPIILLTAKAEDMDKLMGFDHGADDYLTKPFNILELKARIRALLRRAGSSSSQAPENILSIGNITLDLDARNAYRGGTMVDLTAPAFWRISPPRNLMSSSSSCAIPTGYTPGKRFWIPFGLMNTAATSEPLMFTSAVFVKNWRRILLNQNIS